jgi:hypothetical protein
LLFLSSKKVFEKKKGYADGGVSNFGGYAPQQSLYFFPLPQLHGSSGFGFASFLDPQQDILFFTLLFSLFSQLF